MKKIYFLFALLFSLAHAQIIEFSDINFKNALLNHSPVIDTNGDGEIQISEAMQVNELNIVYKGIQDLDGISEFQNLQILKVTGNNLTTLNLSSNVGLIELNASKNQLITINLPNTIQLHRLDLSYNALNNIDVSNNPYLLELNLNENHIITINVNENNNLQTLMLNNNQINSIDLTQNVNLIKLYLSQNSISTLDLNNNLLLTHLYVENNPIADLNSFQNHQNLIELEISDTNIQEFSFVNMDNLRHLGLGNTPIIFTPSDLQRLSYLNVEGHNLTSINVSENWYLRTLNINNNAISELDLSQNVNFLYLLANNNLLENLDLSNNRYLFYMQAAHNNLQNIIFHAEDDLSHLTYVDLSYNQLQNITGNFRGEMDFMYADFSHNQISELNMNNHPDTFNLSYNSLTSFSNQSYFWDNGILRDLDISHNPQLNLLDLRNMGAPVIERLIANNNPNLYCILVSGIEHVNENWVGEDFQKDDWTSYTEDPNNCEPLAVSDVQETQFEFYPNPTNDKIHIKSDIVFNSYQILDTSGKLVQNGVLQNQQINVNALPIGAYLVQLKGENKQVKSFKIMKR